MKNKLNNRNIGFDFLKVFYAILILLLHYFAFSPQIGKQIISSFYICCEGFFIISGIFLMKAAEKTSENTITFVFKKYLSLLPYLIIGALMLMVSLLIDNCIKGTINENWPSIILQTFFFIVPISMFKSNFVIWFISTLLVGYLIYFPFAKKFKNNFPYFALAISILIYICIYIYSPTIDIQNERFLKVIPFGYLRALAGLGLGIFIEKICSIYTFNIKKKSINILIILSIFILLCLFVFLCLYKPRSYYEIILIFIMFLISWIINNKANLFNNKLPFSSKHLTNFSTILYLTHPSWIVILNLTQLTPKAYLIVFLISAFSSSALFVWLANLLRICIQKISILWNKK